MNRSERALELLRKVLKSRCKELVEEEKDRRHLFFCENELVGSVVRIDEDTLAVTVYSPKMSDPLHKEFVSVAEETFGEDITESGTKLSSGIDQNFYYTYLHVKL
ncbi:hypothetical protein [Hydrogenivirga sp.]